MSKWILLFLPLCMFLSNTAIGQDNADQLLTFQHRLQKQLPDTTRGKIQLELARFYLYSGSLNKKFLDSAAVWYKRTVDLYTRKHLPEKLNDALEFEGLYNYEAGNFKKGKECFEREIKGKNLATKRATALAWYNISIDIPVWDVRTCEAKAMCHEQEQAIYHQLNDKLKETLALKDLADARLNQGELNVSETELLEVLKQLKSLNYQNLHHTYYLLSVVYHLNGDQHKELFYSLATVNSMEATRDTAYSFLFYSKLASVYEDLGMVDKSVFYFKKILRSSGNNPYYMSNALQAIIKIMVEDHQQKEALAFFKKNLKVTIPDDPDQTCEVLLRLSNCYMMLDQYKLAEPYIIRMDTAVNHIYSSIWANLELRSNVYATTCDFYLHMRRYQEVALYLNKINAQPQARITPETRIRAGLFQFKIDSAAGKYFSAIQDHEFYKNLSDSIYNSTKSKQIAELQISYETSQKEKDLQLLKKQAQIQQVKLEKKNLFTNLMIISLILVVILLIVLFNRYKIKQRNNLALLASQKEISAKNLWLEKLLKENEWLLREVNHRVKNNLHIIMGLLQSQSSYLKDELALNTVKDSQRRVQSMSLTHQKLYQNKNISVVYMPEYVSELVDYLKDSFEINEQIYFQLEIDPIKIDAAHVVTVGLILNELITNAIKYAFPYGDNDTVKIQLTQTEKDKVKLVIADNGRGLPTDFDIDQLKSFGMLLVKGLVSELDGTFNLQSLNGTTVAIIFNISPYNPGNGAEF
jgi:two-component sensor histidine kinase